MVEFERSRGCEPSVLGVFAAGDGASEKRKSPRLGLTRIRPHAGRHTGAMVTADVMVVAILHCGTERQVHSDPV